MKRSVRGPRAAVALLCGLLVVGIALGVYFMVFATPALSVNLTAGVLIDPGHGGADVGAISPVSGAHEAPLNLEMALALKAALEKQDVGPVTLTRADENALGPTKDADMEERSRIIRETDAALMVSIHMNSFTDPEVWGPQVFYDAESAGGKRLAQAIQNRLNEATGGTRSPRTQGLIVLRAASVPAVLVECGFLTNPEEDQKLRDGEYQAMIAEAIALGILDFGG